MNKSHLTRNILTIATIVPSFVIFFVHTHWIWIVVGIQAVIVLYFFKTDFSSFVHVFFWPLFLASQLSLVWPLSFIIPLIGYFIIVLISKKVKNEITWLKIGKINHLTIYIMVPTIIISSAALIMWVVLLEPDLTDLKGMIPVDKIALLIVGGLLFSVFNSMWEEMILKGILWNGLETVSSSVIFINVFQAVLFGILHLNGFPKGIIGALMAGVYGLFIGFIRKSSNGILFPIVTHFFADATIFAILVTLKR